MKTPEAVVFDLGKVLVEFDWTRAAASLAPLASANAAEIRHFLLETPSLYRYETGLLTTAEFFAEVQAGIGFRGDLAAFDPLFSNIFTPITGMIELHGLLRQKGIPTYIFSNTNDLAINHIRANYPFFHHFDGYVLSYEHQAMKPQTKLYEVVESVTGRSGPALAYLDDRPENIATALTRGWHAILHETPEQSHAALRKAGLPV